MGRRAKKTGKSVGALLLGTEDRAARLLELRERLLRELADPGSPGLRRALELADIHLFMALQYCGYVETLCPEVRWPERGD
jgi:hypothetical protein